jgi:hypothetical protein
LFSCTIPLNNGAVQTIYRVKLADATSFYRCLPAALHKQHLVKQLIVAANPVVATLLSLFKDIIFVLVEAVYHISYFPGKN